MKIIIRLTSHCTTAKSSSKGCHFQIEDCRGWYFGPRQGVVGGSHFKAAQGRRGLECGLVVWLDCCTPNYLVFLYLRPPWYLYLHLSAPSVYLKPGDPRLIGIQKCSLDKWSSHQSSGCHCNGLLQPLLPEWSMKSVNASVNYTKYEEQAWYSVDKWWSVAPWQ